MRPKRCSPKFRALKPSPIPTRGGGDHQSKKGEAGDITSCSRVEQELLHQEIEDGGLHERADDPCRGGGGQGSGHVAMRLADVSRMKDFLRFDGVVAEVPAAGSF